MPRKRKPINWNEWPDVLTVSEVARPVFGWTPKQYYYHAGRGRVPCHRCGNRMLIYKAELMRHLGIEPERLPATTDIYPAAI